MFQGGAKIRGSLEISLTEKISKGGGNTTATVRCSLCVKGKIENLKKANCVFKKIISCRIKECELTVFYWFYEIEENQWLGVIIIKCDFLKHF